MAAPCNCLACKCGASAVISVHNSPLHVRVQYNGTCLINVKLSVFRACSERSCCYFTFQTKITPTNCACFMGHTSVSTLKQNSVYFAVDPWLLDLNGTERWSDNQMPNKYNLLNLLLNFETNTARHQMKHLTGRNSIQQNGLCTL
jgi:hypothetical protein